jgi:hypothetical protein
MTVNPFGRAAAPAWLADNPAQELPRLLDRLLDVAGAYPQLYDDLPWLRGMNIFSLFEDELSRLIYDATPPGRAESTLTDFFAAITRPIADLVEALYTAPLLRDRRTVGEILRRMARAAGQQPLGPAVVNGLCASFFRRRVERLGRDPLRQQPATWQISWQSTTVRLRERRGISPTWVVLVTDQATGQIRAVRCTPDCPGPTDVQLALYDALVFPQAAGRYPGSVTPPSRLRVQAPLAEAVRQAAQVWRSEVQEIAAVDCALVQQVEQELGSRILEPVQFLRILDGVCERTNGYAPFAAKCRAARLVGCHVAADSDPLRHCLGVRELLPAYPAQVDREGTVAWQGWHYRDYDQNVLQYFPDAAVTVRPSPRSEAVIAVYWQEAILCCAVADELRHADGSYRPYWFPYPQLGE